MVMSIGVRLEEFLAVGGMPLGLGAFRPERIGE